MSATKNETMVADMISFDAVKTEYEQRKTRALESMVEEMEKYGMSRIEKQKFEDACQYVRCSACDLDREFKGNVGDKCDRCLEYEKSLVRANKIVARWMSLLINLNTISSGNEYKISLVAANPKKRVLPQASITREKTIGPSSFKVNIYSDCSYSRRGLYSRPSSSYTAIHPDWSYKKSDTKKVMTHIGSSDIDLLTLAKKVHKKAQSLFDAKERELDRERAVKNKDNDTIDLIKSSIDGATDVHVHYYYDRSRTRRHSRKDGFSGNLHDTRFKTYDGKKYSSSVTVGGMTPDQLQEFVKMVDKFKKEVARANSETEEN